VAKAVDFVVANDRPPIFTDDRSTRLANDDPITFARLFALTAQVVQPTRTLRILPLLLALLTRLLAALLLLLLALLANIFAALLLLLLAALLRIFAPFLTLLARVLAAFLLLLLALLTDVLTAFLAALLRIFTAFLPLLRGGTLLLLILPLRTRGRSRRLLLVLRLLWCGTLPLATLRRLVLPLHQLLPTLLQPTLCGRRLLLLLGLRDAHR
jgi:hypothetical protein